MTSTKRDIEEDIRRYTRRKNKLVQELDALPPKGRMPAEGKKLRQTRRRLEREIKHVETLIGWAKEALYER
jgi:hypothetical protein